jgi:Tfp pilus assembly protein PilN
MSAVQFNLLPDSKLAFNRTQNTKRLVIVIAAVVSAASLVILLIMLVVVDGVQKKMMDDAASRVDKANAQLQKLDTGDIITVQSQLQALPMLHQNKHITSRIFSYLPKITPPTVSINKLDLDLTQNTMSISGTASSQKDVNTFVDTLKFAQYKIGSSQPTLAFQNVVESGFNINSNGAGYTIDMQIDPKLFMNNLKDNQGNPVTPVMSVDTLSFSSSLKSPSSTLFNSSQSSTE